MLSMSWLAAKIQLGSLDHLLEPNNTELSSRIRMRCTVIEGKSDSYYLVSYGYE
jgi:hypothetical protein